MPKTSLTDQLLTSDTVAFARQDPADRFSFQVVRCLKGQAVEPIDLFLDSPTRRRLTADPDLVVLLSRKRDTWRRLAVSNRPHQQVVRRLLAEAEFWEKPFRNRTDFFLPLLSHPHRDVQELAYLELGRVPYEQVRHIASRIPASSWWPLLRNREYLKWRPLAILLLAQNADAVECAYIEDQFANCRRFGLVTNLAAWTTASIEIAGESSVDVIQCEYLEDLGRTEDEVRGVLAALAVHGAITSTPLRARIVRAYNVALRLRPQLARLVVSHLSSWPADDKIQPDFDALLTTAKELSTAADAWTVTSRTNESALFMNHAEQTQGRKD